MGNAPSRSMDHGDKSTTESPKRRSKSLCFRHDSPGAANLKHPKPCSPSQNNQPTVSKIPRTNDGKPIISAPVPGSFVKIIQANSQDTREPKHPSSLSNGTISTSKSVESSAVSGSTSRGHSTTPPSSLNLEYTHTDITINPDLSLTMHIYSEGMCYLCPQPHSTLPDLSTKPLLCGKRRQVCAPHDYSIYPELVPAPLQHVTFRVTAETPMYASAATDATVIMDEMTSDISSLLPFTLCGNCSTANPLAAQTESPTTPIIDTFFDLDTGGPSMIWQHKHAEMACSIDSDVVAMPRRK